MKLSEEEFNTLYNTLSEECQFMYQNIHKLYSAGYYLELLDPKFLSSRMYMYLINPIKLNRDYMHRYISQNGLKNHSELCTKKLREYLNHLEMSQNPQQEILHWFDT